MVESAAKKKKVEEDDDKIIDEYLFGLEEQRYEVKDKPVRSLSKELKDQLRRVLRSHVQPRTRILSPEHPEVCMVETGIMQVCFRSLGVDKKNCDKHSLWRARHWDSIVKFVFEWYQMRMESTLKSYTESVNRSK